MRPRGPARLGVAATLGLACSTLAPSREVTCTKDEDCPQDNQVCSNGECFVNDLPPPQQIGLDVANVDGAGFRVELIGTDQGVERVVEEKPVRYRARLGNVESDPDVTIPGVRDRLELTVVERRTVADKTLSEQLAATLELSQASRLRRDPVKASGTYTPFDELGEPITRAEVVLPWARYTLDDDLNADFPLILTVRPTTTTDINEMIVRAPILRQLIRKQLGEAATHTFEIPTRRECHRLLVGNVVVGDNDPFDGVVAVDLLHTHSAPEPGKSVCDPSTKQQAVCSPNTLVPNELPSCSSANDCPAPYGCYPSGDAKRCGCSSDAECRTGEICDLDANKCALDLLGLPATNSGAATEQGDPTFRTWVYTYCEDDLEAFREMSFVVRATPAIPDDGDPTTPIQPSTLPPLSFDATVDFPPSNEDTVQLPGNLCFPPWQPPQPVAVAFTSAPQEVYRDAMDRPWICCSASCVDQATDPPPVPDSCPVTGALTARTLYLQDPVAKLANGCLGLTALDPTTPADSQWIAAGKVQIGACIGPADAPAPCQISLSRGEGARPYELRLEPPVGSLVRSMSYTAVVDDQTVDLPPPEQIAHRVLLRGSVALQIDPENPGLCNTDGALDPTKCTVKAEILAERLRLPDEDPAEVLGPFFYTTRTLAGADFILPVNPGVYLVTALPEIAAPGGPAKIDVVDLRLDSDLVDTSGPLPTATLADPLLLSPTGQFVIFELDGFDPASVGSPLDLDSWRGLAFAGRELDLSDTATCWGDPGRACAIRRLRPGNSGLALTQEQFVKFITRGDCERADAGECLRMGPETPTPGP